MITQTNNYKLGRGKNYFGRFRTGTKIPEGERYFGNCPAFTVAITSNSLDHYSSEAGTREKDDSATLDTSRTASITTDNISKENQALALLGDTLIVTNTALTVTDEAVGPVIQGLYYQLGTSPSNPTGHTNLDVVSAGVNATVKNGATTYVEGDDYTIDMTYGRLFIVPDGAITSGTNITVSYKVKAGSLDRVLSGTTAQEGCLRFISNNPKGSNNVFFMPWVKISPNGDLAQISEQDWMNIQYTIEILKSPDYDAAIYCDGLKYAS